MNSDHPERRSFQHKPNHGSSRTASGCGDDVSGRFS